jgi:protein-tyrosine phosphatase
MPEGDYTFDFHWIIPRLAVGAEIEANRWGDFRKFSDVLRVVDLRAEAMDDESELRRYDINFLHLPTPDLASAPQEMLWQGVQFIRDGWEKNEKVFVHCRFGIGRSALLAACALVTEGYSPSSALELLKRQRPVISPSPAQLEGFFSWCQRYTPDRH